MKTFSKSTTVIVACAVWCLLPTPSLAEAADGPMDQAKQYMELGQEAFNQQRFGEAARQFVNAYSASPFAAFLYNAGLAYERAEDTENAIDLYRRYLESDPEAQDYDQIELKIKTLLAALETPPSEKEAEAAKVEISEVEMKSLISVRTNPTDAAIRVLDSEGKEISKVAGPLVQTVERGKYTIEASHPSYRTVTTEVSVASGQVYVVVVEMSQGSFLGLLRVITDVPGAAVYIDDKAQGVMGETPFSDVLPAGEHTVWIEKPGYLPVERKLDVAVSDKIELDIALERLAFGALCIKTNRAEAQIFVNDIPIGTIFDKKELSHNLPAGIHKVRASSDGMKDYLTDVEIKGGQVTKVLVRFNSAPSRVSAWVSVSFSMAFFISGGVFGGFALHEKNELDAERRAGTLASDDDRILRGFLFGLSADLSFGVGALIGGLSIYYFRRDPLPPSEGKHLPPVDFEENPEQNAAGSGATPVKKSPAPAATGQTSGTRLKPRLMVLPVFGTTSAGLGLSVVF